MSLYKDQLNQWVSSLDVKADRVLDIGGAQNPIKGRTKSWEVGDYKILDLENPHVELQRPDVVWDMNQPMYKHATTENEKTLFEQSYADLIFMLGVMDYVINPNVAMDNIKKVLSKKGCAWIEWPLFYGHHEPLWDEGCRYSEGCIMRLLQQAGLKMDEIIRKPAGNEYLVKFMLLDGQRLAKDYRYHNTVGFITKVSHLGA